MSTRSVSQLPFQVIACPQCKCPSRFLKSRWGMTHWDLHTDFARVSQSTGDVPLVVKCPHCRECFWRHEAVTLGYVGSGSLERSRELFGADRVPCTGVPSASDLERALVAGLPRYRSDIRRVHLMAWRRLNDGLRFEPRTRTTAPSLDAPIRSYISAELLKAPPNRHPLTRIFRIDVLRQTGKFSAAEKSATSLLSGLGIVKSLGEWESNRRNEIYRIFANELLESIERKDRLPRRYELSGYQKDVYHHVAKEAARTTGTDDCLRPVTNSAAVMWSHVERKGWTCHNCGRGGRSGEDFVYNGCVICRHCGWPQ